MSYKVKLQTMDDETIVEMDECVVALIDDNNQPILKTEGISTCIAFAFCGDYQDIPYIGLYHWAGFSSTQEGEPLDTLNDLFEMLADTIDSEMETMPDKKPKLNELYIIGGERKQVSENKHLLVSGTEIEIELLKKHSKTFCNTYFETNSQTQHHFRTYLTSNLESIGITVSSHKISYHYEQSTFLDDKSRHRPFKRSFGEILDDNQQKLENEDSVKNKFSR